MQHELFAGYIWNSLSSANKWNQMSKEQCLYRALVRFFPSMPAHVDHQHVLCLEGLLLSRAFLPPTHKLLLLPMDVVIVDVLEKTMTELKSKQPMNWIKCNVMLLGLQITCCSAWGNFSAAQEANITFSFLFSITFNILLSSFNFFHLISFNSFLSPFFSLLCLTPVKSAQTRGKRADLWASVSDLNRIFK